jgi:hypothetical protein
MKKSTAVQDLLADPFKKTSPNRAPKHMQLLGACCSFESDSHALLRLVDAAYAGLPRHRLSATSPKLCIKLQLTSVAPPSRRGEPAAVTGFSAHSFLGGTTAESNFVMLSTRERAALVVISPRMLRFPYHTRYEYIEFAVFTLAARVQGLIPLHAACIGSAGRGILLMGPSGSGKSTVALHSLLQGLDFLAEDAVFVDADTLRATGIANYLHVSSDSLHWLEPSDEAMIRRSPVIRRRSGVRKFEVDLRRLPYRLAAAPLQLTAVVFLSSESAGGRPLLRALPKARMLSRLDAHQAYAANQPRWHTFTRNLACLDAFELRRGTHPGQAVGVLRQLLGVGRVASAHGASQCALP